MERTLFDKIIDGEIPSWKVWEDANYFAFLTPFPNTPGVTIVVSKKNPGDYVFNLEDEALASLMIAAKKTAKLLEKALEVQRVAVVFEGEAVPHVHVKLYPMHNFAADRSDFPKNSAFFPAYPGFISSVEGPRMSDEQLNEIQKKIQEVNHEN